MSNIQYGLVLMSKQYPQAEEQCRKFLYRALKALLNIRSNLLADKLLQLVIGTDFTNYIKIRIDLLNGKLMRTLAPDELIEN